MPLVPHQLGFLQSLPMSRKKYIELPQGYLSYSQMMLWLSSPKRYADLYFDRRDELKFTNPGQEFGKMVATSLEEGVDTGDLLTDSATLLIPKYDTADEPIHTEFRTKHGWLKLIGKPDTFDSVTHAFREDKTGKVAWTQKKAQNHPQMIFYAITIWLKYETMNTKAHLDWIETEYVDGITKPTGHIQTFEVTFTRKDYFEFMSKMVKVASEIELAWASHITNPELVTF